MYSMLSVDPENHPESGRHDLLHGIMTEYRIVTQFFCTRGVYISQTLVSIILFSFSEASE